MQPIAGAQDMISTQILGTIIHGTTNAETHLPTFADGEQNGLLETLPLAKHYINGITNTTHGALSA